MAKKNPHRGASFESFLEEEGRLEKSTEKAIKAVLAWQLARQMKAQKLTKAVMAKRLKTSRSQLDRLLDPKNDRVTLSTLSKAARAVGKRVRIDLVDAG